MANKPIDIIEGKCKACGICYALCPKKAIASDDKGFVKLLEPDKCIKCGICEAHCPDYAIFVRREKS